MQQFLILGNTQDKTREKLLLLESQMGSIQVLGLRQNTALLESIIASKQVIITISQQLLIITIEMKHHMRGNIVLKIAAPEAICL